MHACLHISVQFSVAGHGYAMQCTCASLVGIQGAEWSSGQTEGED